MFHFVGIADLLTERCFDALLHSADALAADLHLEGVLVRRVGAHGAGPCKRDKALGEGDAEEAVHPRNKVLCSVPGVVPRRNALYAVPDVPEELDSVLLPVHIELVLVERLCQLLQVAHRVDAPRQRRDNALEPFHKKVVFAHGRFVDSAVVSINTDFVDVKVVHDKRPEAFCKEQLLHECAQVARIPHIFDPSILSN